MSCRAAGAARFVLMTAQMSPRAAAVVRWSGGNTISAAPAASPRARIDGKATGMASAAGAARARPRC